MDSVRMVLIIAGAIIAVVVAFALIKLAVTIITMLVWIAIFAGVLYVCFLFARSTLRNKTQQQ
jgi:hypothetical protein